MLLKGAHKSKFIDRAKHSSRNTNPNTFAELWNKELLGLEIRLKLVVGLIVRVANAMTVLMSNSGYSTTTRHNTSLENKYRGGSIYVLEDIVKEATSRFLEKHAALNMCCKRLDLLRFPWFAIVFLIHQKVFDSWKSPITGLEGGARHERVEPVIHLGDYRENVSLGN